MTVLLGIFGKLTFLIKPSVDRLHTLNAFSALRTSYFHFKIDGHFMKMVCHSAESHFLHVAQSHFLSLGMEVLS